MVAPPGGQLLNDLRAWFLVPRKDAANTVHRDSKPVTHFATGAVPFRRSHHVLFPGAILDGMSPTTLGTPGRTLWVDQFVVCKAD